MVYNLGNAFSLYVEQICCCEDLTCWAHANFFEVNCIELEEKKRDYRTKRIGENCLFLEATFGYPLKTGI